MITCGLSPPLSTSVTVPLAAPVFVGLNVTLTVHFVFRDSPPMQVLVEANGPVVVTLPKVSVLLPWLVTVMFCGALVVPTLCAANVSVFGA